MSGLIDKIYINYVASRLERFRWIRGNLAVSKCPFCGDGHKGNRTRFYLYQDIKHGTYRYNVECKNCGHSQSFFNFLKETDSGLFSEYRMELFRDKYGRNERISDVSEKVEEKLVEPVEKPVAVLEGCTAIQDLPDGHPCKQYVASRKIPEKFWNKLFYAPDFRTVVAGFVNPEYAERIPDDGRLVIPFFDSFGNFDTLQGRSLEPDARIRYVTVKRSEEASKTFGLDRVNRTKTVYVVEGPIDSLFVDNCLAAADADLLKVRGDVYIPDFQYRNKDVVKHIEKMISAGVKVVLFPNDFPGKDINDAIKNGLTIAEVKSLIDRNTFSGLRAKLRFGDLRKC